MTKLDLSEHLFALAGAVRLLPGTVRRLAELVRVEGLGPDGDYRITHPIPSAIPTSTGESS